MYLSFINIEKQKWRMCKGENGVFPYFRNCGTTFAAHLLFCVMNLSKYTEITYQNLR